MNTLCDTEELYQYNFRIADMELCIISSHPHFSSLLTALPCLDDESIQITYVGQAWQILGET